MAKSGRCLATIHLQFGLFGIANARIGNDVNIHKNDQHTDTYRQSVSDWKSYKVISSYLVTPWEIGCVVIGTLSAIKPQSSNHTEEEKLKYSYLQRRKYLIESSLSCRQFWFAFEEVNRHTHVVTHSEISSLNIVNNKQTWQEQKTFSRWILKGHWALNMMWFQIWSWIESVENHLAAGVILLRKTPYSNSSQKILLNCTLPLQPPWYSS